MLRISLVAPRISCLEFIVTVAHNRLCAGNSAAHASTGAEYRSQLFGVLVELFGERRIDRHDL